MSEFHEGPGPSETQELFDKPKVSARGFQRSMEANTWVMTQVKEVKGWENYYNLPRGIRPVIGVTHLTDTDPQIAAKVFAKIADVGIASLQTNQRDPVIGRAEKLAGENFFDVANTFDEKGPHMRLDAGNFLQMAHAVNEDQKTMIIASFTPHQEGYGDRIMPERPGLAAVIVANLTDRVILPVAIEFHADKEERVGMATDFVKSALMAPIKRIPKMNKITGEVTESTVHIAEPLFLDKGGIPEELVTTQYEVLQALHMFNAETRRHMTAGERARAADTLKKLRKQGEVILLAQAAELPPETRGVWQEQLSGISGSTENNTESAS